MTPVASPDQSPIMTRGAGRNQNSTCCRASSTCGRNQSSRDAGRRRAAEKPRIEGDETPNRRQESTPQAGANPAKGVASQRMGLANKGTNCARHKVVLRLLANKGRKCARRKVGSSQIQLLATRAFKNDNGKVVFRLMWGSQAEARRQDPYRTEGPSPSARRSSARPLGRSLNT
jgi:hypothetical protein